MHVTETQPRAIGATEHDRGMLPRSLLYRAWGRLPPVLQAWLMRLGSPKVTMGACAVVMDAQGRVLLAHHTYRRRAWGLPGGLIGSDEQPAHALARELAEELGVAAAIGPLLYAETNSSTGHLTLFYRATITGVPRADGAEIDSFRYMAPGTAAALLGRAVPIEPVIQAA